MKLMPLAILALAMITGGAFAAVAADQTAPNIVLINIDDLGYGDISPFGGQTPTPHLDRMARDGMRLTSHYAAPVCSPSRAAMMTGCYPKRVLPIPGVLFPASEVGLSPEEMTLAEVLKTAGYSTGCVGKWHLGDQFEFLPRQQGFDYYYGIPYSNDMGLRAEGAKSNPGQPIPNKPKNPAPAVRDETGLRGDSQPPLPLLENNDVIERVKAEGQHTITRRYTEQAVEFIKQHHGQPFFLYLPHSAVHWPHYPHHDFVGKSGKSLQKDWVMEVDWSVGQIMQTLTELNLDANTLVIFTSDNGGPVNQGADNGPLRGSKGSTWEGGMRVCTIARWPGKIAGGSQTAAITAHMDWLPTFAAIAGAELPSDRTIDGIDLTGTLLGQTDARSREQFLYYKGLDLEAVRDGDWKLHLVKGELFHLKEDLAEQQNVADRNPEVVQQLKKIAQATSADLGQKGANAPGVRTLGRVDDAVPMIDDDGVVGRRLNSRFKTLP